MSARFAETYFIDIDHSYALSERADIINYVPTRGVFIYRTDVNKRRNDECLSCTYSSDEFRDISFYVAKAYLLERERRSFAR